MIYDQLLINEIDEDRKPDGRLFRTDRVTVSNATKVVHVGVLGETRIEEKMLELVKFMNVHDVPSFEKCFIAHYYFEYIHPFYDGNGRTGRFIACSYLSRKLDYLSAISFSSAIVKNKAGYINSFQEVSHRDNRGEITHFILDMLRFVNDGQHHIIQELTTSKRSYELSKSFVNAKPFSGTEKTVLDLLIQQKLFGNSVQEFTDKEILSEANKLPSDKKISRAKLDQAMRALVEKNVVRQTKRKPSIHVLTKKFEADMDNIDGQ
jgi:Fic family protein